MVYQLMLKAGVSDEKTLRKCAFPILDHDLTDAKQAGEYRAAIARCIGSLPDDIRARIEAIQPCATNHEWFISRGCRNSTTRRSTGWCWPRHQA